MSPIQEAESPGTDTGKRIIVISDTHIGTSTSLYPLFEQSFIQHAEGCAHIVLNGDIFDFGYFNQQIEERLRKTLMGKVGAEAFQSRVAEGAIVQQYIDECLGRLDKFITHMHQKNKDIKIHFVIGNSELVGEFYTGLDALVDKYPNNFEWDKHSILIEDKILAVHGDEEVRQLNEIGLEMLGAIKQLMKLHMPHKNPSRIRERQLSLQDLDQDRPDREAREQRSALFTLPSVVFQPLRGITRELVKNTEKNMKDDRFTCTSRGETYTGKQTQELSKAVKYIFYGHSHVAQTGKEWRQLSINNTGAFPLPAMWANHGPAVLMAEMNEDNSLKDGTLQRAPLEIRRNEVPLLAGAETDHHDIWNGDNRHLPKSVRTALKKL